MGSSNVYVQLVDRYYATGKAFWMDEKNRATMMQRANAIRPVMIGKVAPNFSLETLANNRFTLAEVTNDYTVIVFYESDCGHCIKATSTLAKLQEELKDSFDIKFLGIKSSDETIEEWTKFIAKTGSAGLLHLNASYSSGSNIKQVYDVRTTPKVMILSKDKRIIASRISPGEVGKFIRNQ